MASRIHSPRKYPEIQSEINKTIEEIREHDRLLSRLITRQRTETNIRKLTSLNQEILKEERLILELNYKVERLRDLLTERSTSKSKSKSKSKSRSKSKISIKKDSFMGSRMFPTIKPGGKIVKPNPLDWSSYVLIPSILDGGKRKYLF